MRNRYLTTVLLLGFFVVKGKANECVARTVGTDAIVCVCNATYCDSTPETEVPENGNLYWYVSSKGGLRMSLSTLQATNSCRNSNSTVLDIDTSKRYQTIFGYGAAFTDSAGMNIGTLSQATQDQLMRAYFDPVMGSGYLLGRIPIGGTDFSTRPYTYDDVPNDVSLQNFSLAPEDYNYKIPYIKKALQLNPNVKFVSCAWSAPPWMKTNDKINGFGFLRTDFYQLYVNYLLKFLDAYANQGIQIWGISTGNEPLDALVPQGRINTMGWTPGTMGDWIANNLGPSLEKSVHNKTLILAMDDQRILLPWFIEQLYQNKAAEKYTSGTAVHWYSDFLVPATVLNSTHNAFPNKFILLTEASIGSGLEFPKVSLGSWNRGQRYMLSIIEYMNNWSIGWLDWNLALNSQGGPNWINNFVDSPIIVNPERDEFYKQPMYYALKHFSRFVNRGSVRVSITDSNHVKSTAFVTPNKEVVVVLYNNRNEPTNVTLKDSNKEPVCLELPADSMNTIIYAL
ncbi:Lysosomal acid glucosylceramidase [Anthophora plagiata]